MSRVVVAKFGGSSMADAEHFTAAKQIIARDEARRYVVPSAPGKRRKDDHKVTDLLYMCHQLAEHNIDFGEVFTLVANRYRDIYTGLGLKQDLEAALEQVRTEIIEGASEGHVASRGEYLNGLLLAEFLGYEFVDAADVVVFSSDGVYDADATMMRLGDVLGEIHRAVIPGFYGADQNGSIHTFSRGGSDVSGAIVASAVGADLYENWTDVSGFLQADPRVVTNPAPIETVSYKELRELSYMGASVLHEEAIFPVREKSIPINVRNTERPEDPGTLIVPDSDRVGDCAHTSGLEPGHRISGATGTGRATGSRPGAMSAPWAGAAPLPHGVRIGTPWCTYDCWRGPVYPPEAPERGWAAAQSAGSDGGARLSHFSDG